MFGDDTSLAVITGAKKVLTDRPRELPRARGAVGLNAFPPSTYEPTFQQKSKKIEVISSRQKDYMTLRPLSFRPWRFRPGPGCLDVQAPLGDVQAHK